MKKVLSLALATALALAPASFVSAEEESEELLPLEGISGSAAFTTDYVWRGFSQTSNGIAVQGSLDYAHESGFYLGAWGSNIDFDSAETGSLEVDLYTGFSGEFMENFTYDAVFTYYLYPGADRNLELDFYEIGGTLGYDFGVIAIDGGLFWTPEFAAKGGKALYGLLGAEVPLPGQAYISGHLGAYEFDNDDKAILAEVQDYLHWDIGVGIELIGLEWDLRYTKTDLDSDICGSNEACDGRVFGSVSYAF